MEDEKQQSLLRWKAHAYDVLANIEALQRELQATNQKIAEEMQKQPAQKPEEKK